jgi:hypothetical protein
MVIGYVATVSFSPVVDFDYRAAKEIRILIGSARGAIMLPWYIYGSGQ